MVLAGCAQLPSGDGDDDGLIDALTAAGLSARWLAWDDPEINTADGVVLRATWDYPERLSEFLAWADGVDLLINSAAMVRWNSDKGYMLDLEAAGIPIVPTAVFAPDETVSIPDGEVVVKPAVAGGSRGAARFTDPRHAADHAAGLQAAGHRVLVQPFDAAVNDGETALVYIAGQRSHAFTKGPMLPEPGEEGQLDESGLYLIESLTPAKPSDDLWELGDSVLTAAAAAVGVMPASLLYARVDLLGTGESGPRLLEFEAVEPSLGWRQLPATERGPAMARFALATAAALARR
ncbi:glutathione synthase/RimK-type ligase-like ATP-grasp enzyme [Williamsia limnetica]|uniref:Glutathione synthase/RimK-type ligase-like ATP-grasp enzyme n=1 Tax=Williamsia limnetica TaxID=882452 RepID=A0A318RQ56_WILLI|nr:glutathione synthase/RimK-type ligase-like ATP-grasp enzyme [Williamsia limnetica]